MTFKSMFLINTAVDIAQVDNSDSESNQDFSSIRGDGSLEDGQDFER